MNIRFERRLTLGRAWALLDELLPELRTRSSPMRLLMPAGDVRRVEPVVNGIVLVAVSDDPDDAFGSFEGLPQIHVLRRQEQRARIECQDIEIDVRIAAPGEHGSTLFQFTGTPAHVRAVNDLSRDSSACATEKEVYARAGLPFIAPELRSGADEIDAALSGRLPALVQLGDIRGDLHMHTHFSDGRDSVEAMVDASRALGYEYIAVTDHSQGAGASRTLQVEQIAVQRDEIARLRELHRDIDILHGVEVDILPDGRLDFSDDVLEQFDLVIASLHDSAGQDGQQLTRRSIDALRHPLVNVLSHPSNQLVGRRPGYPLDYETLFAAAVETGTALEIDGAPSHLDLDGEHARAAVRAGVTIVIDSDSHRSSVLERQMALGVGTARRGWVQKTDVLNTRPRAELRAFVARKRASRP